MNKRVGAALLALWMLLGAAPALGAAQRLEQTHQAGKVEVIFDAVVAPPLVENAQPLRVRYKQWTDQEIARFWLEEEAPPKGPDVDYTGPDGKSLLGLGGEASIYVSHWIDIEYTLAMCNLSANADHTQGQLENLAPMMPGPRWRRYAGTWAWSPCWWIIPPWIRPGSRRKTSGGRRSSGPCLSPMGCGRPGRKRLSRLRRDIFLR